MSVTTIIVSYNSENLLKPCIDSIIENTKDISYDIIVVDNASEDGSVNLIKNNYPQVKLIENNSNVGFAKAVNIAVKETNSEFIFLLNPDTILINNSVKILHDFMKSSGNTASCGGALYDKKMNPVNSYGFFPSLRQIFFEEYGLRKIFKNYYFENLSPGCPVDKNKSSAFPVDYVSGADVFLRKDLVEKAGYLDESFFLYYEETELSFRFNKMGYKNMIVPDSKIIHLESESLKEDNFKKLELMTRSEFLFFKKCYGNVSSALAKIILLEGCLLKLIFKFDKNQFKRFKIILNS